MGAFSGENQSFKVFFFVGLTLIAQSSYAKDPNCAGIVRDVFALGGEIPVPQVEAISEEREAELSPYSPGYSVHDQLNVEGNFGFVAVREERVVGYVVVERRTHFINILRIAVSKNFERQGVGRDLVNRVVAKAKTIPGVEDVRVMVASNDLFSQTFFSHVGLSESEVIPHRFVENTVSGVLFKTPIGVQPVQGPQAQPQAAPQIARKKVAIAVEVLEATPEYLHQIDPTLENAD